MSEKTYIKTPSGLILGWTKYEGMRLYAYNANGKHLGWFDGKFTRNTAGTIISQGDITTSLIWKTEKKEKQK